MSALEPKVQRALQPPTEAEKRRAVVAWRARMARHERVTRLYPRRDNG